MARAGQQGWQCRGPHASPTGCSLWRRSIDLHQWLHSAAEAWPRLAVGRWSSSGTRFCTCPGRVSCKISAAFARGHLSCRWKNLKRAVHVQKMCTRCSSLHRVISPNPCLNLVLGLALPSGVSIGSQAVFCKSFAVHFFQARECKSSPKSRQAGIKLGRVAAADARSAGSTAGGDQRAIASSSQHEPVGTANK